jgi:hypothetical protein
MLAKEVKAGDHVDSQKIQQVVRHMCYDGGPPTFTVSTRKGRYFFFSWEDVTWDEKNRVG